MIRRRSWMLRELSEHFFGESPRAVHSPSRRSNAPRSELNADNASYSANTRALNAASNDRRLGRGAGYSVTPSSGRGHSQTQKSKSSISEIQSRPVGKVRYTSCLNPLTEREPIGEVVPVHDVPDRVYVFRPTVLVMQVIGVFLCVDH